MEDLIAFIDWQFLKDKWNVKRTLAPSLLNQIAHPAGPYLAWLENEYCIFMEGKLIRSQLEQIGEIISIRIEDETPGNYPINGGCAQVSDEEKNRFLFRLRSSTSKVSQDTVLHRLNRRRRRGPPNQTQIRSVEREEGLREGKEEDSDERTIDVGEGRDGTTSEEVLDIRDDERVENEEDMKTAEMGREKEERSKDMGEEEDREMNDEKICGDIKEVEKREGDERGGKEKEIEMGAHHLGEEEDGEIKEEDTEADLQKKETIEPEEKEEGAQLEQTTQDVRERENEEISDDERNQEIDNREETKGTVVVDQEPDHTVVEDEDTVVEAAPTILQISSTLSSPNSNTSPQLFSTVSSHTSPLSLTSSLLSPIRRKSTVANRYLSSLFSSPEDNENDPFSPVRTASASLKKGPSAVSISVKQQNAVAHNPDQLHETPFTPKSATKKKRRRSSILQFGRDLLHF